MYAACGNWGLPGGDPAWDRQHDGVELTVESMPVMRSIFQSLPVSWLTLKPKTSDRVRDSNGTADKRALAGDLKKATSELTNITRSASKPHPRPEGHEELA